MACVFSARLVAASGKAAAKKGIALRGRLMYEIVIAFVYPPPCSAHTNLPSSCPNEGSHSISYASALWGILLLGQRPGANED